MTKTSFLDIPRARSDAILRISEALKGISTVAITTHINADGDAAGSVAAMARLLPQMGAKPVIVNPTPWPAVFSFLKKGQSFKVFCGRSRTPSQLLCSSQR